MHPGVTIALSAVDRRRLELARPIKSEAAGGVRRLAGSPARRLGGMGYAGVTVTHHAACIGRAQTSKGSPTYHLVYAGDYADLSIVLSAPGRNASRKAAIASLPVATQPSAILILLAG